LVNKSTNTKMKFIFILLLSATWLYTAAQDVTEPTPKNAQAYNNRGLSRLKTQNYHGAIEDYTKAIELNPTCDTAYNRRGYAKYMMHDSQGA
jgi:lipoprotein NlpI